MSRVQVSEIDLFKLATKIWRRRVIFLSVVSGCVILTIIALHIVNPKYTVSMSVAPVQDNNTKIGSGGLSALAKLGGINLSNITGGIDQFGLFISALSSRDAANMVATDTPLMKKLFPEQWSESENRWVEPTNPVHTIGHFLKAILGIPSEPWHAPNGEQVYDILTDNLQIDDDPKNPIVTISLQSDDPEAARELLVKLTGSIDAILRQRALKRANDYIGYLTNQLNKVTVADYREALVQHLFDQEQTRMMASANVSFAAQVFSGPSRSNRPTAPKSILLLVFSFLVGSSLGAFACVYIDSRKNVEG